MSSKILRHPNKSEIVEKLISGESTREVESWLKEKYPSKKAFHISYMTLQKFRKEELQLKGDVLDDIKSKRQEIVSREEQKEKAELIYKSKSYREKIEEIANTELDITRKLLELDSIVETRIEYYYNILQNGGSFKDDKMFLEYINTMRSLMQDWKKYIEGFTDQRIENNNINITIVNQQVNILKSAILETLEGIDPSHTTLFLDNLSNRLNSLDYENAINILED
mgnify:CR=1 FL=1|tara:strand:+ start:2540 stop:3214 length:675 start_codon:yes stop_codon:yes gene_type:complete